jgi:hypothetical protein
MDNVRSEGSVSGAGACNGTSSWDQNTSGQQGWRCRDQIGAGPDSVLWQIGAPHAQTPQPAYFWDNRLTNNAPIPVADQGTGRDSLHIRANRDYYTQVEQFNGTAGVGVGSLAQRPSRCTVGVGYWATDQGEWMSDNAVADGQLYTCVMTDTWALTYTPYPFPHPWTTNTTPSPPPPPPNPCP